MHEIDTPMDADLAAAGAARTGEHPVGRRAKRAFDLLVAVPALLLLSPLLLGIAIAIRLSDGGPALYRHTRIGLDGRPFACLKFRSMVRDADAVLARHLAQNEVAAREWAETRKLKDDPRITRLGDVLRKTRVDELPQLVNIVRGDMSVVGPRPIVAAEIEKYGPHIDDYVRARPGLTGAWQVSGRSDVTYGERVRLDTDYVNNWSLARDVVIIVRTIPAVLASRGSY